MLTHVLAIMPDIFRDWMKTAEVWVASKDISAPEEAARLVPQPRAVGDVAIIPIRGFISQKPSVFSMLFGGTSTEALVDTVRMAVADPNVASIIFDVNSPGGEVFGVSEAANAIRALRGSKPMITVANPLMGSAAYHLGAQADEIVSSPSSLVGSIGAFQVHVDESEMLAKMGVKLTPIQFGKNKLSGAPFLPLSDEAQASMQSRVDYFGHLMEADIAKGRQITQPTVHSTYGQGDVFIASEAKNRGLVDRIATLETVASYLAKGKGLPKSIAAAVAPFDAVEVHSWARLADLES